MSTSALTITPGTWPGIDEPVVLRPSGMLVLPARATGFVADLHLGKTAHFQRAGLAVPHGADEATLTRLEQDLQSHPLQHLVVLGDLVHSRQALTTELHEKLQALRARWPALHLHLVWGNHDRHAREALQTLLAELGWHSCPPEGWYDSPVRGLHDPEDFTPDRNTRLTLLGHLHPGVRLKGSARQQLQLPCFAAGPSGTEASAATRVLLPAYGSFTGQSPLLPKDYPWVYAIAGDTLLKV